MSQSPQNRDDRAAGTPPKTNAPQARRASFRDKKITVTLSLPKAVFGVFFSLFVLIWVFIFGVMLGRGHNPEDVVPELAKVMPTPAAPAAPANTPADATINDVLTSQDLKYHDTLKSKDPVEKPRPPAPVQQAAPPQPAAPAKPQTPPPVAPKPAQQTPAPKPAPALQKEDQDKTVYNYVYQVAAFNNSAAAQAMQKKLQDGGVASRITQTESGGTVWYRLLVSFKGKPEETRELRAKLAPYGISTIILRGKTPAK
ncbi:conserved hypothetical protein [uncultured delta proteobacterium]|uniref:SPOR domain-containing protein n=1 Tax=uncultured delta proteobacterium TaxID=34034 RepID=A0A212J759_9DELT|nr:conserved hypothetical protein [uncultured delta proteobacterium]